MPLLPSFCHYAGGLEINCRATCLALNRWDEASAILNRAKARGIDSVELRLEAYHLAFLQGDAATMAHEVAWSSGKLGIEGKKYPFGPP